MRDIFNRGLFAGDVAANRFERSQFCQLFDADNFDPTGSGSKGAVKIATYKTADTIAAVETNGYFDGRPVSDNLVTGDFLAVYSSAASGGGAALYNVTVTDEDVALTLSAALS